MSMKDMFQSNSIKRRILSGALCASMVVGLAAGITGITTADAYTKSQLEIKADAVGMSVSEYCKGTVTLYEWTKITNTRTDIPQGTNTASNKTDYGYRMMLLWKDNGRTYAIGGNREKAQIKDAYKFSGYYDCYDTYECMVGIDFTDDAFVSYGAESFVTSDDRDILQYCYWGYTDGGNGNNPYVYCRLPQNANGTNTYIVTADPSWDYDSFRFRDHGDDLGGWDGAEDSGLDGWTIYDRGNGYVSVFRNDHKGNDEPWGTHGSLVYCLDYGGISNSDLDTFLCYIGRPVQWSCLGDYKVTAGQVLNIDDNVILNGTLTIEPGAVVSVEGQFYNNGIINNYGTIVVQENSSISGFDITGKTTVQTSDSSSSAFKPGTINNYGSGCTITTSAGTENGEGSFIIMNNAKVILPAGYGTILFDKGSILVNDGVLVAHESLLFNSGATLCNRSKGTVFLGYKLTNGLGSTTDLKVTGDGKNLTDTAGNLCLSSYCRSGIIFADNTNVTNDGSIIASAGTSTNIEERQYAVGEEVLSYNEIVEKNLKIKEDTDKKRTAYVGEYQYDYEYAKVYIDYWDILKETYFEYYLEKNRKNYNKAYDEYQELIREEYIQMRHSSANYYFDQWKVELRKTSFYGTGEPAYNDGQNNQKAANTLRNSYKSNDEYLAALIKKAETLYPYSFIGGSVFSADYEARREELIEEYILGVKSEYAPIAHLCNNILPTFPMYQCVQNGYSSDFLSATTGFTEEEKKQYDDVCSKVNQAKEEFASYYYNQAACDEYNKAIEADFFKDRMEDSDLSLLKSYVTKNGNTSLKITDDCFNYEYNTLYEQFRNMESFLRRAEANLYKEAEQIFPSMYV